MLKSLIRLLILIPISILLIIGCSKEPIKVIKQPSRAVLQLNKQYIIFYVDFSKPSTKKRFFIKQGNKVLYSTWVAHGVGSGKGIWAISFSNRPNSNESSLGVYQVASFYYRSKHGVALKLRGVSKTNSNAYQRLIEIHSAKYIGYGKTGHSLGCFAVPEDAMKVILKYAKIGTELIAYK